MRNAVNHPMSDSFAGAGLVAFVVAHFSQINEVAQFVAAVATTAAAIISVLMRFHRAAPKP